MGDSGGGNIIRAFEAGRRARTDREDREREQEERKLRLQILRNEMAREKQTQAVEDFKAKYAVRQGQPGPSVPGVEGTPGGMEDLLNARKGDPQVYRAPLSGLEEQNFPHLPVAIPEHLGGGTVTPQTQQEVQRQTMQDLIAKRKIEALTPPAGQRLEPIGAGGSVDTVTGERIEPFEKPVQPAAATQPLSPERFRQEQQLKTPARDFPAEQEEQRRFQTEQNALNRAGRLEAARVAAGSRPATAAALRAATFYYRMKDALDSIERKPGQNIESIEEEIRQLGTLGQLGLQHLPNLLQSELGQLYRQGQRQFTEARLRKDSGAAIREEEYEQDAKIYFSQPGDTKATLERKRAARTVALQAIQREAGKALEGGGAATSQEFDFDPATGQLVPR